ncbi:glycosyltransferase family 4 protein [Nocardia sp. NPDC050406]|uniref:glycosyltransferase family 4 protein n=1 Tax=Nocardia sp. NPDC050406 TaxID=3364318 RepID=UPI0037965D56
MKAVFLADTAAPTGAELATSRLLSALPRGRVAVVHFEDGPMVRQLGEVGIETRVVRGEFDVRGLFQLSAVVARALRELGATVVVAGSVRTLIVGALAARRARVPLIWHVHERISSERVGRARAVGILLLGWVLATGYIANSRGTLRLLPTWRRPAVVAYPGVAFGDERMREEQRDPPETVIAVVGRLAPWKGQALFLRALADVRVQPREVFLVGANFSDDDTYPRELETLATALDLPVVFTGYVDDPEPYLRVADILVHCSVRPEAFGQVVVEGMRAGCAVIATRPGGPEEIIEPGVNGLLVRAGDRHQLTHALDTLIADQELRIKLSAAGSVRARDFDITESARTVWTFLGAVTEREGS